MSSSVNLMSSCYSSNSNCGQSCWKGLRVSNVGLLCIVCVQLGVQRVSIIQNSRVCAIQGSLMYWGLWGNSRDFQYIVGVRCWGLSFEWGSTVLPPPTHSRFTKKSSRNFTSFPLSSSFLKSFASRSIVFFNCLRSSSYGNGEVGRKGGKKGSKE